MIRLFPLAVFLLAVSPAPVRAGDLDLCIDTVLLTQDLPQFMNEALLPSLGPTLAREIQKSAGGKDPRASISGFKVAVLKDADPAKNRLQISVDEFKYNARYLDTPLFSGPRVGVKGPLTIKARLAMTPKNDAFLLKDIEVAVAARVDMGGTVGQIIGPLLTAIANAFKANGDAARAIRAQLEKVRIGGALFSADVRKDNSPVPISLQTAGVSLDDKQLCASVSIRD
jgi:hypothetical protein